MAGRGRGCGRGKGSIAAISEALGVERGNMPSVEEQPPPMFPPLQFKPCPLDDSEEERYRLVLKQQLRVAMRGSPYYIRPATAKRDIERYSDKYRNSEQDISDKLLDWKPDWRLFPKELKMRVRKKGVTKGQNTTQLRPTLVARVKKEEKDDMKPEPPVDVNKQLEELEKQESTVSEAEKGEQDKEEEVDEEADYVEEEMEEENDYNLTYFDNGEDYVGFEDEDGLDDGGAYY